MRFQEPVDILVFQPFAPRCDLDRRVQRLRRGGGLLDLRGADAGGGVDDLAVQVGQFDLLVIKDRDMADACRGKVEDDRRSEPACADNEDTRREKPFLPVLADRWHDDLTGVAFKILVAQHVP